MSVDVSCFKVAADGLALVMEHQKELVAFGCVGLRGFTLLGDEAD